MKGIEFVNEKGSNWLEQETKSIYGTASKIGSCFPVRLDPKSEFTVQQGVEWILHTLTPTCNTNIPGTIGSTSAELHTQLQSTYEELFNTFTQVRRMYAGLFFYIVQMRICLFHFEIGGREEGSFQTRSTKGRTDSTRCKAAAKRQHKRSHHTIIARFSKSWRLLMRVVS